MHLALGHTDMRKGLDGLATLIQEHLKKDPVSGHLFVFTKRMDHGSFWSPRDRAWRLGDADAGAARDADRGHLGIRTKLSGPCLPSKVASGRRPGERRERLSTATQARLRRFTVCRQEAQQARRARMSNP